ncbi:MAG: fluoride efflux transporter CrcB [Homoserinimonas sp.]|nr:fluoride efflux transporter CrcB [Homoserinimonas sp.]
MSAWLFALLALAGGIGAAARFTLDGVIRTTRSFGGRALPWGTILINISGSLLLGFIVGLAAARLLPVELGAIIGSGFLGGYTTFSTASFETVWLIQERKFAAALVNGFGSLVGSCCAAAFGLWLGSLLS